MKKFKLSLAALLMVGATFFTSCDDDDEVNTLKVGEALSGNITSDLVIEDDAQLTGKVHVKSGVTLKIKAGSKITADASVLSYLLVEQGAKIEAIGTASDPIIFTADASEAGAWGGLHICGKAPINSGDTGLSEIGNALYGGSESDDNSGNLEYVRIEYSGTILDGDHEANGISFYGVGAGTTVDHVEIYIGKDDGIEFFGGAVNVKHAKVYGAGDDSFDWTEGWTGKGQYWMAVQAEGTGDRGIEGDNLKSNNTASPYSSPMISQLTLIGNGAEGKYGMKLREGTKGNIKNFIVTGFEKRSIHVEHDQTLNNVNGGSLVLDYGKVNSAVADLPIKYSKSENGSASVNDAKKFETSANIEILDLTSGVNGATTYAGGVDATSLDPWFDADTNIGSGNNWAAGWTKSDDGSGSHIKIVKALSGDVTEDVTLAGSATLTGEVHVKAGVTLTVKAGTVVTADASDLCYLLVEQGAKLIAEGTEDDPIIFTANSEEAGAWGGLHICGKAPINSGDTGLSEIGNSQYGGTVAADNSGVLKYVRVEYSGTILDGDHEANGISFYGVGSGTTVDFVEIYIGKDDGIEFFGGSVNVKHALVYGAGDDSFDWTEGWSGKGQYWIAKQADATGDRGIEGDNLKSNNTASPYSNPMLSQVTLIGNGAEGKYGMKLREGTKGQIINFVVTNFEKRSIHVEHDQTLNNVNDESLKLDFGKVNNVVADAAIKYSKSENGTAVVEDAKKFETSANIELLNLTSGVDASTTYTGGKDASTVDAWFDADSKIGAGSDWTANWTK